ncbi:MAG: DUF2726 domain-containing protein [Nitrosomonas sp.]|nr:DUF2726 domain-containing protein [Nitrosomonas sp.]
MLCDKGTLAIVAAIELDDSSHYLSKTYARDIFVQKACDTAGLKLIRFACRPNYSINAVRNAVLNSLNPSSDYSEHIIKDTSSRPEQLH